MTVDDCRGSHRAHGQHPRPWALRRPKRRATSSVTSRISLRGQDHCFGSCAHQLLSLVGVSHLRGGWHAHAARQYGWCRCFRFRPQGSQPSGLPMDQGQRTRRGRRGTEFCRRMVVRKSLRVLVEAMRLEMARATCKLSQRWHLAVNKRFP